MAKPVAWQPAPPTPRTWPWNLTKDELADVKFKEIASAGVAVRGVSVYNVYSLDETVLFDTEKAVIKPGAAEALQQVAGSIG